MTTRRTLLSALTLGVAAAGLSARPANAAGGGGSKKKKLSGSEDYIALSPVAVATSDSYFELRGVLQVELGLEVKEPALRARAERMLPRLRDAQGHALAAYSGEEYEHGIVPDPDRIAERLQVATDWVLGETGATVLLAMVIVHAKG